MAVLLIAEVNGGTLSVDSTAKALTAAKQIGEVTVLCVGSGCTDAAQAAAKLEGVSKVLCAQSDAYGHDLAEPIADLIVSLSSNYTHIVAPSTSASKNILPRVAALLDVMIISEVTAVIDADTFERPIQAYQSGLKTRLRQAIVPNLLQLVLSSLVAVVLAPKMILKLLRVWLISLELQLAHHVRQ